MTDRKLTDADVDNAPLRINVEAVLADGTRVVSKSFIPREDWDSIDDASRLSEVKDGLKDMADAVYRQIEKNGFPAAV